MSNRAVFLSGSAAQTADMPGSFLTAEGDEIIKRRMAYRRERDMVANATTERLLSLLDTDDEIKRTAARDELWRRNERGDSVGT